MNVRRINAVYFLFLLLVCCSCKEEPEKPEPVKTDCYDRLTGEYLVHPDTDSSFTMKVSRIDSSDGIVYFDIRNFNNQFDMINNQYCSNSSGSIGINFSPKGKKPAVDRENNRYYIFGYEDDSTEVDENSLLDNNTIYFYYHLVNIAFYHEDSTDYYNDTLRQFARKIK